MHFLFPFLFEAELFQMLDFSVNLRAMMAKFWELCGFASKDHERA